MFYVFFTSFDDDYDIVRLSVFQWILTLMWIYDPYGVGYGLGNGCGGFIRTNGNACFIVRTNDRIVALGSFILLLIIICTSFILFLLLLHLCLFMGYFSLTVYVPFWLSIFFIFFIINVAHCYHSNYLVEMIFSIPRNNSSLVKDHHME